MARLHSCSFLNNSVRFSNPNPMAVFQTLSFGHTTEAISTFCAFWVEWERVWGQEWGWGCPSREGCLCHSKCHHQRSAHTCTQHLPLMHCLGFGVSEEHNNLGYTDKNSMNNTNKGTKYAVKFNYRRTNRYFTSWEYLLALLRVFVRYLDTCTKQAAIYS